MADTRIIICGGPRTGKTTLASELAVARGVPSTAIHSTDLIAGQWSEVSDAAAKLISARGPWIIEGVAAFRALRKWMDLDPGAALTGVKIVYLKTLGVKLNKGQLAMAKGVGTVWSEIQMRVVTRGGDAATFYEFTTAEGVLKAFNEVPHV